MFLFVVIMFAVAAVFAVLGRAVSRGRVDLIHEYHRKSVTNEKAYGKDMGQVLLFMAASFFLSGMAAVLKYSMTVAIVLLFLGIGIGIGRMITVQKKYNGGIF